MNQQYRIPTLTSQSGTHPGTVAVGDNLVLKALAQWDAMVAATSQADVKQLSAWARLRGTVGYQPLYVLVWRASDLVAGAQICIDASPAGPVGYLPYGPLIAPRSHAARRWTVSSAARSHASPLSDSRHCQPGVGLMLAG